jgi:hypothetical protein
MTNRSVMANERPNPKGNGPGAGFQRSRVWRRVTALLILCLSFSVLVQGKKKYAFVASPMVPGARGQAEIDTDKNGNTRVKVKLEFLAPPESLTPAKTAYVVWFREREDTPLIQGTLRVDKNRKAELETTTPWKEFAILITAEDDASPKTPNLPEVLKAVVQP